MSTVEVEVRQDGTVLIPAEQVIAAGATPGQRVAVELHARTAHHRPSRGLLKGVLPRLDLEEFRAERAERLSDFEQHHDL